MKYETVAVKAKLTSRVRTQPSSCSSGIVFFSFLSLPQRSVQPKPVLATTCLPDWTDRVGETPRAPNDGDPRLADDARLVYVESRWQQEW